jgi:hypothetical protein
VIETLLKKFGDEASVEIDELPGDAFGFVTTRGRYVDIFNTPKEELDKLQSAPVIIETPPLARPISDMVAQELAEFDALAETADAYGRAVSAAAFCQLRRGA